MDTEVLKMGKSEFYKEFTLRNAGFISDNEQAILRNSVILIAGCGSTGGSIIELLVRSGAENLILVDNGRYDLNNSNRQNMTLNDIDEFKPDVFKERCLSINPFVNIEICNIGITPDNVDNFVSRSDIVIDAVDVTGRSGLEMKFLLHQVCHHMHKPVICGYDMAATQYIPIFDYRDKDLALFDNQITTNMVAIMEPLKVCTFLVPISEIPEAMFEELERSKNGKDYTSQLGIAANLFGTITMALIVDMLNHQPVKKEYTIDVWKLIRGEYENPEKLEAYRQGIKLWQDSPCEIEDNEFLQRSIRHYQAPLLPELLDDKTNVILDKGNLLSLGIKHSIIDQSIAKKLLRYSFVHYAQVGFINQKLAAEKLLHSEPLSNLKDDDVHIVVIEKATGRLLAYSTLKAPVEEGVKFSKSTRLPYSVETAFNRKLYADIAELKKYKAEQVREIGRVVKTQVEDANLAARTGIMLLNAYRELLTAPENDIKAVVGDGEEKVTIRNLNMYGFNPNILNETEITIPSNHLYSSRYSERSVFPFWLELKDMEKTKYSEMEALLEEGNISFFEKLNKLKSDFLFSKKKETISEIIK